jgi:hypothetical protein
MYRIIASAAAGITVICLLLCSCFSESEHTRPPIHEVTISDRSTGINTSIHRIDDRLYVIYPSLDALSLNLLIADIAKDPLRPAVNSTTYLDRISYSPDIDETFGRHLFLAGERLRHILYIDRESEENSVLKWLSKTEEEDTWWIDALPRLANPLAAIPEEGNTLQAVVAEGSSLSLYRLGRASEPTPLGTTKLTSGRFRPLGDVSMMREGDFWAFTAYDGQSRRLYLVYPAKETMCVEPVHTAGEVHHSTLSKGRLRVLLFAPGEFTITLLERPLVRSEPADQQPFDVHPVTLCEGTSSVFLTTYHGQDLFLFNERTTDQENKRSHQLSLLYPDSADEKYEKLALFRGDPAIRGFHALRVDDVLYVLYLRGDALTLLTLSLSELARF